MLKGSDISSLCIPGDHPSLPGHFPGRPIVPGVVLLDRVISRAEQWLGRSVSIASLQHAKFMQPLLPEERATVALTYLDPELKFEILKGEQRIAQGSFKLRTGPSE